MPAGFLPPAWAMPGRPPPPPPTRPAIALIRLPAWAPFFCTASVAVAIRFTLPSCSETRTTTPSPNLSFNWSPRLRRPFISTPDTFKARTLMPLTSFTWLMTSPRESLASRLFNFSFSEFRDLISSNSAWIFEVRAAGVVLAALAASWSSASTSS